VPRSSRYLSLLMGVAVFFPFLRLGRRLVGPRAAELAAFALAISPLHLQASTTAASEALYLFLWVASLERLVAGLDEPGRLGRFVAAGLLASLAAVTRYDAWLALPVTVAAAWLVPSGPRPVAKAAGLALFAACAALLPAVWLVWGALRTDDAFFFAHYITSDHAGLAAAATARFGAWLGRARQLGIWSLSFVAAMTLPAAAGAALGLGRRMTPAMRVVVAAALAPPALYLAKGLLFLSFEPLPRFALVPGALLLPLGAAAVPEGRQRAAGLAMAATTLGFAAAVLLAATAGRPRIWAGAESVGPLTRIDAEDRALADYLRAHRRPGEPVMLEPLDFAEIAVAEEAGVPMTESVSLTVTREPAATVAATAAATGARWFAGYDRSGGWPRRLPDWPADSLAFGRWRLARR
jgi:4-amino-4-deoxy-L-arabinose transferase-like glycosyltransferase